MASLYTLEVVADSLTGVLQDALRETDKCVTLVTLDGEEVRYFLPQILVVEPDWGRTNDSYEISYAPNIFARYKTYEQVIDAITVLLEAIKRGDVKFTFPTADALDLTPDDFDTKRRLLDAYVAKLQTAYNKVKFAYDCVATTLQDASDTRSDFINKTASIAQLKDAVDRNELGFDFPTADELTALPEPAVEETAESLPESPNNDGDELIDAPEVKAPVDKLKED